MRIQYAPKNFRAETQVVIAQANQICEEYSGVSLTLRQLYYQFVARGLLANRQESYDRLSNIVSDARMAGEFDWNYIVDRTRNLQKLPTWGSPEDLIVAAAKQYRTDTWAPQKRRVEVWIEKDAAIGVIEHVCEANNVPYFSCRGYTSSTEMWNAANRIGEYLRNGEQTTILHVGDHDPSGLDMTRDIGDRLRTFISHDWAMQYMGAGSHTRGDIRRSQIGHMQEQGCNIGDDAYPWRVKRIALTIEQIEEYAPPPNYAKMSDSRYEQYVEQTGLTESWELDALDPLVMEELIQDEIDAIRQDEAADKAEMAQEHERAVLTAVAENWETIKAVHGKKVAK